MIRKNPLELKKSSGLLAEQKAKITVLDELRNLQPGESGYSALDSIFYDLIHELRQNAWARKPPTFFKGTLTILIDFFNGFFQETIKKKTKHLANFH